MDGRVRSQPFANEAKAPVDRDVVAVAEYRNCQIEPRCGAVLPWFGLAELDGPAGVAILVVELGRFALPILRHPPGLDVVLLRLRVVLTWRSHQAGIDDLTRHGDITGGPQQHIEAV